MMMDVDVNEEFLNANRAKQTFERRKRKKDIDGERERKRGREKYVENRDEARKCDGGGKGMQSLTCNQ